MKHIALETARYAVIGACLLFLGLILYAGAQLLGHDGILFLAPGFDN